jgi:transaldolase
MSLASLISTGTKVWLDSIDPALLPAARQAGVSGATSNPLIIANLLESGRFDKLLPDLYAKNLPDDEIAWTLTDHLVADAQNVFLPVWDQTRGNDGYVSFELDPLLEDPANPLSYEDKVRRYIYLGKRWGLGKGGGGHQNRLIKVPATPAGIDALEPLAAAGVPLNITLIFTARQYQAARDAIWRGAQTHPDYTQSRFAAFKSCYSIFISRIDVYTKKHLPTLSDAAQGLVGIVNAKRLWHDNQAFWKDNPTPLQQEIIFASTGTKLPTDPPDKYVAALAGSDIQTNPPETNAAVEAAAAPYSRTVDILPPQSLLDEIDQKVDMTHLERTLLEEGVEKFAAPFKTLLKLIAQKRP